MTVFPTDKKCSKCGDTFRCSGILGCWCGDVKLDPATLAMLKERYDNCLCPACLKGISDAAQVPPAPTADPVVTRS